MSSPICFLVPLYAYCLSHSWECYESYLDILPYNAKPWGGTVVDCSSRDSVGTPGGVPPLNVISMFAWGGVSLHVYPPKKCKLHIKRSRPVLRVREGDFRARFFATKNVSYSKNKEGFIDGGPKHSNDFNILAGGLLQHHSSGIKTNVRMMWTKGPSCFIELS